MITASDWAAVNAALTSHTLRKEVPAEVQQLVKDSLKRDELRYLLFRSECEERGIALEDAESLKFTFIAFLHIIDKMVLERVDTPEGTADLIMKNNIVPMPMSSTGAHNGGGGGGVSTSTRHLSALVSSVVKVERNAHCDELTEQREHDLPASSVASVASVPRESPTTQNAQWANTFPGRHGRVAEIPARRQEVSGVQHSVVTPSSSTVVVCWTCGWPLPICDCAAHAKRQGAVSAVGIQGDVAPRNRGGRGAVRTPQNGGPLENVHNDYEGFCDVQLQSQPTHTFTNSVREQGSAVEVRSAHSLVGIQKRERGEVDEDPFELNTRPSRRGERWSLSEHRQDTAGGRTHASRLESNPPRPSFGVGADTEMSRETFAYHEETMNGFAADYIPLNTRRRQIKSSNSVNSNEISIAETSYVINCSVCGKQGHLGGACLTATNQRD